MTDLTITREGSRFVTHVDGHEAELTFTRIGDVIDARHTGVPKEIGGRGIASQLVRALVDHARAEDLKIRPTCSYVARWLERHPEAQNLAV